MIVMRRRTSSAVMAALLAAAFCMFNRYVDDLATWAPEDPEAYRSMGLRLANQGYLGKEAKD